MNIKNLFDYYYWFRQPYIAYGRTLWLIVGIFLFFIVAGLVCRIIKQYVQNKAGKTILHRAGTFGITMGFLGLLWMFLRQERVPFLAWRFWLLILLAVSVWWAVRIVLFACRRAPKIQEENDRKKQMEKYLPKSR
jgi:hypothetical protein